MWDKACCPDREAEKRDRFMRNTRWIAGASALAVAICAVPAAAQDADVTGLSDEGGNEIVVTAQRREQSLQDVPLAVSAISEDQLVRLEATSTQGLLRLFPNVSGAQITGSGANNYSIRGLSNAETAATFDSPVGTYVDGIYMARVNANNFALFDIERIEVLRGPQGTLFGRNTTGGAINVILKKPGEEFGARLEGAYGSFDHKLLRGSIDAPLADGVRARISGYWQEEDGWVKNVTTGGTENDHDGYGVRGALSIDVSPAVTWDIAVDYLYDENSNIPAREVDGEWVSRSGLQEVGDIVTGKKGDIPGNRVINETTGITSHLTIDAEIGTINFITGFRHLKTEFNLDYFDNPSVLGGYDSLEYSLHDQFSQEVNLSGSALGDLVDYTVGLFYFHDWNDHDFATILTLGAAIVPYDRTFVNTTDSLAAYGQLDWHFTPELTLTTGGRWTTDTKKIDYEDNGNPRVAPSARITNQSLIDAGIPLSQTASVFTPRVALTYEPSRDLMFFASATKGFKSGGWNIRAATVNQLGDFENETIWSFEGGVRSQFWDRKATFNLTGFYGYTKNFQIATASGAAVTSAPVFPVGNFSDYRSYGFEAEATLNPVPGLSLFGNIGMNWTEYANPTDAVLAQQANCQAALAAGTTNANCGGGIIRLDGEIAAPLRAPKFTSTLGFTYEAPITDEWSLVPTGSWRHVSSFNVNAAELPTTWDDGYDLFSASIALENRDRGIRASFGCENCSDANYLVSVIAGYYYYTPPRRWTGRVSFDF